MAQLDIVHNDGFLAAWWQEMINIAGRSGNEPFREAWLQPMRSAISFLLQGPGLPYEHRNRILYRSIGYFPNGGSIFRYVYPALDHWCPPESFARLLVHMIRLFPTMAMPDHVLWRALLYFHVHEDGEAVAEALQQIHTADSADGTPSLIPIGRDSD